ncbi:MAG: hypothetical protein VB138_02720, partial [Burkholderia sp.]
YPSCIPPCLSFTHPQQGIHFWRATSGAWLYQPHDHAHRAVSDRWQARLFGDQPACLVTHSFFKRARKKVTLVAAMRKLLTIINAIAKHRVDWNPDFHIA